MDIYHWQYEFDQVAHVAGIPQATMQSWLARHEIPLTQETLHPGRGRIRRFRYSDVVIICLIADFQRIGIGLQSAAHIAGCVTGDDQVLARLKKAEGIKHKPFQFFRIGRKLLVFTVELSSTALGPTVIYFDPSASAQEMSASFAKQFREDGDVPPRSITIFDFGKLLRTIDEELRRLLVGEGIDG